MATAIEAAIFTHRRAILALLGAITLVLGLAAAQLRIDASFEKHLPLGHPYVKTFFEYQSEFGTANRLLVAVRAKRGDMFTPEFFRILKAVTDEVFYLPGVNRSTVRSIFTPNVRYVEIVEGGFTGGNVVPHDFRPTPEALAQVRDNILKAGILGRLVARDFTAAIVSAELVDEAPDADQRVDYIHNARLLEDRVRQRYSNEDFDVHIVGFVKVVGDIAQGAQAVVGFFAVAFLVTAMLVYAFTASFWLTVFPLCASLVAVLWTLGLLPLLGFGLDPMSILVPFLIFAIGTSHGVQMVNAVNAEVYDGADAFHAARGAFRRLMVPGSVALATDATGFLTLLVIDIGIIRELAITATLGVLAIIITNLLLLPILISHMKLDEGYRLRLIRRATRKSPLWGALARLMDRRIAWLAILAAVSVGLVGFMEAGNLKIGDSQKGVPELRPEARYNRDTRMIAEKFAVGMDVVTVIVETVPNGCIRYPVMDVIDRFQWEMATLPGVRSTMSMPQVGRTIHAAWNEGHLKWRVLPRNPQTLVLVTSPIETSTGLLNQDCSALPVYIFLEDHRAGTIARLIDAVEAYAARYDSDEHRFRLAAGNAGLMAAANQVVEAAQVHMLLWIYGAITCLCMLSFRSARDTLCIVLPLGLVSVLAYALMSRLDIGLKVSTLPVVALGVGIGVDYGIYIFSRLKSLLEGGLSLEEAYRKTLQVTGYAVLITGLTLATGVSTWIFSALKFQADMGVLLAFMFLANMLAALILLPALASVLFTRSTRAVQMGTPRDRG